MSTSLYNDSKKSLSEHKGWEYFLTEYYHGGLMKVDYKYDDDVAYITMNEKQCELFKNISYLLSTVKLKENITLYRGISSHKAADLDIGSNIIHPNIMSTSLDGLFARQWVTTCCLYRIKVPKGTNAFLIGAANEKGEPLIAGSKQFEVILPPGKLKIISKGESKLTASEKRLLESRIKTGYYYLPFPAQKVIKNSIKVIDVEYEPLMYWYDEDLDENGKIACAIQIQYDDEEVALPTKLKYKELYVDEDENL